MTDLAIERLLYPRVSEIISKQNMSEFRGIPMEVLINAQERGTAVHSHCMAKIKDLWTDVKPEHQPYVDAFFSWFDSNVKECFSTSERLYDDEKRFTGEFDLIVCLNDGRKALIDIKVTSKPSFTWPVQIAAYNHLCEINGYPKIDAFYNIHLKTKKPAVFEKIGEEKSLVSLPEVQACAIEHKNITPYWGIFSSALACYDYFDRKEDVDVCLRTTT